MHEIKNHQYKGNIHMWIDKCTASKYLARGIVSSENTTNLPSDCLYYKINKEKIYHLKSVFFNGKKNEFYFKFPIGLSKNDSIEILNSSNGQILHSLCIEDDFMNPVEVLADCLFHLPDWSIDKVRVDQDLIEIDGWILKENLSATYSVQVNGAVMETVSTYNRPDVVEAFQNLGDLSFVYGFKANISVSKIDRQEYFDQGLRFELYRTPTSKEVIAPSFYYPNDSIIGRYPLPDNEQVYRVYGSNDVHIYIKNGYTHFQRMRDLFLSLFTNSKKLRVLDWGCGCAGLGRYFIDDSYFEYFGCDIDGENIQWCKNFIAENAFSEVLPKTPTPYPDGEFDLIFGISVFSHLNEENQFLWLEELHRLLKRNGFLLVSILGTQAISKIQSPLCLDILEKGFVFSSSDHKIGEIIDDQSYYGTAYHTIDYVMENWTKDFSLYQYTQSFLGHQDLVILKKM
ncbi:MAG: class I SAM-dependent methyltransferase [Nostoc sp.]|uniref:class I SAM-dependent methyltransferase n=1 Tax=Nostoc sp. TaxID=1180 RepID=UPI002FF94CDA